MKKANEKPWNEEGQRKSPEMKKANEKALK